jgi:HEAT repeat protein
VRRNCIDAIDHGGFGSDARCQQALLPLLHDPVPHVRRAAWHTLFCERCPDPAKCDVNTPPELALDQVALLIEVGLNDPNPKLRRQLAEDLGKLTSDPRAREALARVAESDTDSALVEIARRALA